MIARGGVLFFLGALGGATRPRSCGAVRDDREESSHGEDVRGLDRGGDPDRSRIGVRLRLPFARKRRHWPGSPGPAGCRSWHRRSRRRHSPYVPAHQFQCRSGSDSRRSYVMWLRVGRRPRRANDQPWRDAVDRLRDGEPRSRAPPRDADTRNVVRRSLDTKRALHVDRPCATEDLVGTGDAGISGLAGWCRSTFGRTGHPCSRPRASFRGLSHVDQSPTGQRGAGRRFHRANRKRRSRCRVPSRLPCSPARRPTSRHDDGLFGDRVRGFPG